MIRTDRELKAQSLDDLYRQVAARKAARERQARLLAILLPLLLVWAVHLTW